MAKKSITKRIRITKRGKVLRKKPGQSHARATKSRDLIRRRRLLVEISAADKKRILALR
jgi:ribosomal protein L35